ncbi:MAG: 50S ribosomal protein L25 [bacterium]|jgi:large subunit ribosomal protein L25
MDSITLAAARREIRNNKRGLRREGFTPGILYGRGIDDIPLAVQAKEFAKSLTTGAGSNAIYSLVFSDNGQEERHLAMVKEIQKDAITGEFLHVDFHGISLAEKIQTKVPVVPAGEAPGVKEGGILQPILREIDVECLPTNIPENITVDISGLGLGGQVAVRDLPALEGVQILNDEDAVILSVIAPRTEAEPEEEEAVEPEAAEADNEEAE